MRRGTVLGFVRVSRDLGVRPHHWSRQQRPVCGWDSLTETEQSVAGLVAEGLSNQRAATRMFLFAAHGQLSTFATSSPSPLPLPLPA